MWWQALRVIRGLWNRRPPIRPFFLHCIRILQPLWAVSTSDSVMGLKSTHSCSGMFRKPHFYSGTPAMRFSIRRHSANFPFPAQCCITNLNLKTTWSQQHGDKPSKVRNGVTKVLIFRKYIPWCSCGPLYANLCSLGHRQKNGFQGNWTGAAASLEIYSTLPQPGRAGEGTR